MKYITGLFMIAVISFTNAQETLELPLWEEVPGFQYSDTYSEKVELNEAGIPTKVSKITEPTLTVFLPDSEYVTGKIPAAVICPGGGYSYLSIDKEGYMVAEWLNSIGMAAFVLKNRLPNDETMKDKRIGPLQDAQRAIRLVRDNAEEWNIDVEKVGVVGFSAGGHLASTLTVQYDEPVYPLKSANSARPDFSVLIYPVISMENTYTHKGSQVNLLGKSASKSDMKKYSANYHIDENTPPVFLVHATDDGAVPVENSIELYGEVKKKTGKVEMHIYQEGGHGFGLGRDPMTEQWPDACEKWFYKNGILKEKEVYLFSYFKGNGEDGLHFAWSEDGLSWEALKNDESFLTPAIGQHRLMRDPCIIRGGDGKFHMVWTTGWTDKGIGYASSEDLIHWSYQKFIPVMEHEEGARNSWAPEITYDPAKKEYMIYWATTITGKFPETQSEQEAGYNHRMYYTTTKDFKEFSPTALLYEPGFNVIDASIIKDKDRYVMFLKDETRDPVAKKNLRVAFAEKLTGPYSDAGNPITGNYWAEGPTTLRTKNGSWVVYFDKYIDKKYGAVTSDDLKTWKDISDEVFFPKGIRHGTVFKISNAEFRRLIRQM
ncbi:prolyl oligopeptidase family serine peptidase [Robertkochia solimangrovi]|uniref:prolyl oligopeptidase family serine peptidase n=1 Tax=Robertkochia solimangrovi TaxID=2213046 RepID=UPI00117CD95C|nr:prolyl oligopeptidase family serine peptidase [Robertkochia solimangrovi]TRZ45062.1 beta-galactosidase [Robertkochia solimangrovi]